MNLHQSSQLSITSWESAFLYSAKSKDHCSVDITPCLINYTHSSTALNIIYMFLSHSIFHVSIHFYSHFSK